MDNFTVFVPFNLHYVHTPPAPNPLAESYYCEWPCVAQEVCRRLPSASTRVRALLKSCAICGGQRSTGAGFLLVLRFPLQLIHCANCYTIITNYLRFEVFTAVTMKNAAFCDIAPCGSCKKGRFGELSVSIIRVTRISSQRASVVSYC
jgi:hypothetical protein